MPRKLRPPRRQALRDQWSVIKRAVRDVADPERCGNHPLVPETLHMLPPMAELMHPELALRDSLGSAAGTKFGLAAFRDMSEPAWRFYTNAPRLRTRAQTGRASRHSLWPGAGGDGGSRAARSTGACLHIASQHLFAHYGVLAQLGVDRAQRAPPSVHSGGGCRGRGRGCPGGGRGRGGRRQQDINDDAACRRTTPLALHLSGFAIRKLRPLVLQLVAHAQSSEREGLANIKANALARLKRLRKRGGRASPTPLPLPMPLSITPAALAAASATWIVVPAFDAWWSPLLQSREAFEAVMLSVARVVRCPVAPLNLAARHHCHCLHSYMPLAHLTLATLAPPAGTAARLAGRATAAARGCGVAR